MKQAGKAARPRRARSSKTAGRRKARGDDYVNMNIHVHKVLLERLDGQAAEGHRSRRSQLELVLCGAFGVQPQELQQ